MHLEVHLDSGDTLLGTCYLKVHIAVKVLKALDVNHGHKIAVHTLIAGDKATGDTCYRRLDGYTCCHKSEGGATD